MNYTRDHADELTGVTDFNGHQITITNTGDDLPSSVTLGTTGDTITTSYDSTDSPASILLKNSTTTLQSFGYTYSPAGTVLNEADTPSSSRTPAAYTYDNRGRVTSMTAGTSSALNYGFDASSSLTTLPTGASGSYDNAGELTSATLSGTTTSYTYDASGQRLAAKQGTTSVASGSWNGAGDLTAYTGPAANMTTASYDASGHRAATTITPSGGSSITQGYVWNGNALLMDSTNAYIYTDGNAPAEQVSLGTGTVTYLNTDFVGSVRGAINNSGALTGTTSYDAWGNPQTSGGLTSTTPFGFAGGYTDPTGLIYLINRYYDPATGQFTSLDPQIDQSLQPYAYTAGDPVSETDPTGLLASGGCTHAVPSCRYDRALNDTYNEMRHITGSNAYASIRYLNDIGFHKSAEATFAIYMKGGGAWDMKAHLHYTMGALESGEYRGYTRITANRQIFYNVWGNLLYGYIGLRENFTEQVLELGATIAAILGDTPTPGNTIERHMGYNMFHRVGKHYTKGAIEIAIWGEFNSLSHYCDVLPFPSFSGSCAGRGW